MASRATSVHEGSPPEAADVPKRNKGRTHKDKGKGKERERDVVIRVKEEPVVVSLGGELSSLGVSALPLLAFSPRQCAHRTTRTTALPAAPWVRWCTATAALGRSTGFVSILRWKRKTFRKGKPDGSVPPAR